MSKSSRNLSFEATKIVLENKKTSYNALKYELISPGLIKF